ncbi:unnamed protein product [Symbiodinium microadriaticum]|nr:unnamed protein product [Symbiodinium microadriaticum]
MVDQVNADGGKHDLAFLFSLQPDPPAAVFVNHSSLPTAALRPFSPLADARLVASTLAYVKEIETLSSRRLEYGGPPKKPGGPLSPPKLPTTPPASADPSAEPEEPPGFPAGTFDKKTDFWAWAAALPRLLLAGRTSFSRFLAGLAALMLARILEQGAGVPAFTESFCLCTGPADCAPLCFGRRGVHLVARLAELTDHLANLGLGHSVYLGEPLQGQVHHYAGGPEALRPYRDTDPSRILITGRGAWDLDKHLEWEPELHLPFLEPAILRGIPANDLPCPAASLEKKSTTLQLMKLWSTKGLLRVFGGPASDRELVRTFGSYKNEEADRLIGDRRGPNSLEGRVLGPSRFLPPGQLLVNISVPRFSHMLVGASTDRSDFYHQIGVSTPRARTNRVGPALCAADITAAGLQAHLPHVPRAVLADPTGHQYHGAFQALFQGDHGGVEYATAGHESMLVAAGLLREDTRLKGRSSVPLGDYWDGLIIDDYFALSCEPVSSVGGLGSSSFAASLQRSRAGQAIARAKAAYDAEGVKGSDHKDVLGSLTTRAGGAHIDSELATVAEGQVLVGAPPEKRIALSYLSLKSAALPQLSRELASGLAGCWTSVLLYRRCLSSCLNSFFTVALGGSPSAAASDLVALPRGAAQEVALLSALAPIIASNVAAPVSSFAYCSDASLAKGATCVTYVGEPASAALWANSGKKGFYTSLDGHRCGQGLSDPPASSGFGASPSFARPLGMDFDFVEAGGPGALTTKLSSFGLRVGPLFSSGVSRYLCLSELPALDLLLYLLPRGRLRSFAAIAPEGCLPEHRRIQARMLLVFLAACRLGIPAVFVCAPGTTPVPCKRVVQANRVSEHIAVPCAFGLSWSAGLCCFSSGLDLSSMPSCCSGCPQHTPSPNQRARHLASASSFVDFLAGAFSSALCQPSKGEDPPSPGLENVLVNDVLGSHQWFETQVWRWHGRKHINVFESEAALRVYRDLCLEGGDLRFNVLVDSSVTLGSHAKGRSSARLLGPSLRQVGATLVAGGLYPAWHYAPTRLNPADDPTRDQPCRSAAGLQLAGLCSPQLLVVFSGLTKPRANWLRLFLVLGDPRSSAKRRLEALLDLPSLPCCPAEADHSVLDFDATLGYPGEGPAWIWLCLFFLSLRLTDSALGPRDAGDRHRMRNRASSLQVGRPVQTRTRSNRVWLSAAFSQWLEEVAGFSLETLLQAKPFDPEDLCSWLTTYGRDLYNSGRPYWHYAETVNAVTAARPAFRRQAQGAWDLAFAWLAEEPYGHHTAMPLSVLLSVLTTCLYWGWVREAGCFALAWGALLRGGEICKALRKDLVFPADALGAQTFVLLRISEPKTRSRAARHQAAKLEPSDLVQVVQLAFEKLPRESPLWPMSQQSLRKRFTTVLACLGIDRAFGREKALDLGSFRPGGATFLLQCTEDSELVRRRGRWVSHKVMEIYLQEVSASTYVADLPPEARHRVQGAAAAFQGTLTKVKTWAAAGIPATTWPFLWKQL